MLSTSPQISGCCLLALARESFVALPGVVRAVDAAPGRPDGVTTLPGFSGAFGAVVGR